MLKLFNRLCLVVLVVMLTACGGGGSGSGSSSNPVTPTTSQVSMDPGAGGVANGASGVSLTPTFVLKFASPMLASSVNTTTIQLLASSTEANKLHHSTVTNVIPLGNITSNNDNTIFSFTPLAPLNATTQYTLNVGTGTTTANGASVSGQFSFTTGNYAIPTVALISPGNNATGVSTTPTIQLQFNEAMQNVTPANVTLHEESSGGVAIAISSITAGANNTYTFSTVESLNQQTSYYIVLNNQISDTGGDALTPITFNFTTGDFTSPVASILTPSNNATNVSVNPSLQIHFSKAVENVNPANITLHTGSLYGPAVAIESITAGANNTYSITPAGALNSLTTYYLDLSGGITDNGGNPLSFTNFSFTTGDFTAPTVVMLSPTNNATKVNYGVTDFSIVVQFSKPVQNVSSNTISVCSDSTSSGYCWPINFIMPQPNNTYEIHLYQYNSQTQYFVKLSSGITDNYGNALAPVTFNFTTDLELNNIQNLAFNGQSAYLVNLTNTVTQCAIESSNGALDNCQQATNNISGSGSGIAFNNDYAYVSSATQYGNSVFKCTVNNNGGELVGCSPATTSTSLAQDIGFYNSMAYIVNYTSNQITQCTPDSGGLFNNCTATGSGFDAPVGIAFANSYAYIANESSATVSQCSITGTGAFGTCNTTGSHFDSPVKIAINGNYAYISNYYSSTITQCTINSVNGNLTNCNKIGNQLFNFPLGIKFNNGYTYIAEAGNRTITKCTVNNTNGSFSNCTTM